MWAAIGFDQTHAYRTTELSVKPWKNLRETLDRNLWRSVRLVFFCGNLVGRNSREDGGLVDLLGGNTSRQIGQLAFLASLARLRGWCHHWVEEMFLPVCFGAGKSKLIRVRGHVVQRERLGKGSAYLDCLRNVRAQGSRSKVVLTQHLII